jgi:hypothetical protein
VPDIVAAAPHSAHLQTSSVRSTRFRLRADANAATLTRRGTAAPPAPPTNPARHFYGRTMNVLSESRARGSAR